MQEIASILRPDDLILITGANGFIGKKVVECLAKAGYSNLRCFVRSTGHLEELTAIGARFPQLKIEIQRGNLLSREDCAAAARGARVIYHLAAGIEKTFPGSFMNSVVTTRNLLDAALAFGSLERFVNISSFAVYSNWDLARGALLDEGCSLETKYNERAEAYAFAKLKQEELVEEYARRYNLRYVTVRPGAVYGPGARHLSARIGLDTFGIFLHLGGSNRIPLTYVDNCAEAIALAGLRPGVEGEAYNVVDDELPTSRQFLRLYKRHGRPFRSLYVPYPFFYLFCDLWERYSRWSNGQLPPAFNRHRCATYWKGNRYTNRKLKERLGWEPSVPFDFAYIKESTRCSA